MPVDYGVKVYLEASDIIDGCQGPICEGIALSQPYGPELMDVALIAEPKRNLDGSANRHFDDVGVMVTEDDRDPAKANAARMLMREARTEKVRLELQEKWDEAHPRSRDEIWRTHEHSTHIGRP